MKKRLLLPSLLILFATLTYAQSGDEAAVANAVEKLRKAMVDADKSALENLSAKDLTYGHSSGTIEDQAAFVNAIVSGKNDFQTIALSDQTIKLTGKDLALVRHNFKAEIKLLDGSTITPDIGILQVWQKQKGQWKLLARQAFKR